MAIVYPNEAVARRWDGALQARLCRAPLEEFLRSRSLTLAPIGVAQDSDNLARATVFIVEAGLKLFFVDRDDGLECDRHLSVGIVACLVSLALAQQIFRPDAWRISALVSTARLLSPWMGLNPAALAAASAAREFQKEIKSEFSPSDCRIMKGACDAVSRNGPDAMAILAVDIAARVSGSPSRGSLAIRAGIASRS